jgi:Helix-turn-helix domain
MTVAEAARELEVSPALVYQLCRMGYLAHTRIGLKRGVIRIDPRDVAAFRAAHRVQAAAEAEADPGQGTPQEAARPVPPRRPPGIPDILSELRARRRARGLS